MNYWLMKSEPDVYGIDRMKEDRRTCWDGIRNYQARNFMRDEMKKGDLVLFYHSNAKPPGAVGVVEVCSKEAYPDHTQFDETDKHYDPKSDPDKPRWFMVDVKYRFKFKREVTLAEIREEKALADMRLIQRGNRLSITPVTEKEFRKICEMGGRPLD